MPQFLSKSKYLSGIQCPKLLWHHYNAKHLIPPPDAATRHIFDQGHRIGALAQQLAPGGVEVPWGKVASTVSATRKLLTLRRPVYEASFLAADVYCRVDILRPARDGRWDLLEVKSGTSVKEVNLHDVAVQAHCLRAAGLQLDRLFLVHINRGYVRQGDVEPGKLFHAADVTDQVARLAPGIGPNLARFLDVLAGPDPDVPIGPHCDSPYECPLKPRCWAFLPDHAVTTLTRAGADAFGWLDRGFESATDVPEDELGPRQRVQAAAVRAGEPQVDEEAVRQWLDRLEYPLALLDFEAFATAVPVFDGTSPYEAVPFQASVHLIERPGAQPRHLEFLATTPDDPRPALAEFLAGLPGQGSVMAWHMSYERRILEQLALDQPGQSSALGSLVARLVDLEEPFRQFAYYHPAQRGSTSIKAVLPALTGDSYEGDEIADGRAAEREFLRAVHGDATPAERDHILAALRRYCEKDTWAMVEVLRVLERAIDE